MSSIKQIKSQLYTAKKREDITIGIHYLAGFRNMIDFKKIEPTVGIQIKNEIKDYVKKYLL